jgi:hypothetical protein
MRWAIGLMVVAGGLVAARGAGADTRRADRPDAGVPLVQLPSPQPAAAESPPSGAPAPRALDSKRTPMPDREALPKDVQDAPLAPPTPPIPQTTAAKSGGGAARVKEIFQGQPTGARVKPPAEGARDPRRTP